MKKYVAIAPEGCEPYLTPGKEYHIEKFDTEGVNEKIWGRYGRGFYIIDDEGDECGCLEFDCEHLNGGNWTIKEVK